MYIKFFNKDGKKSYAISPTQHIEKFITHVWISNEEGEGGQFNANEISSVIYDALDKYFKENH